MTRIAPSIIRRDGRVLARLSPRRVSQIRSCDGARRGAAGYVERLLGAHRAQTVMADRGNPVGPGQ